MQIKEFLCILNHFYNLFAVYCNFIQMMIMILFSIHFIGKAMQYILHTKQTTEFV